MKKQLLITLDLQYCDIPSKIFRADWCR